MPHCHSNTEPMHRMNSVIVYLFGKHLLGHTVADPNQFGFILIANHAVSRQHFGKDPALITVALMRLRQLAAWFYNLINALTYSLSHHLNQACID